MKIEEKINQRTGKLTEGIILKILTKAENHPYGIKVELENGKVGRVKEILEKSQRDYLESIDSRKEVKQIIGQEIPTDESEKVEFKSTFKFDSKRFEQGDGKKISNKDVEKEVSVTIAAFGNAKGGQLYLGVRDNGEIHGLESDFEILDNPNDDKFQRMLWQSIQNYLKDMIFVSTLQISLRNKDKKICLINVPASNEPIFVYDNNTQESYVRIGPKSEKFQPIEFVKYCKTRFTD